MVKVTPYDSNGDAISALFQWDKGIEVTVEDESITEAYNMHFANTQTGEAYVVESTYSSGTLTAQIPDVLLQSTNPVFGYVYDEDDDSGRSTLWFKIKVTARAQPSDYVYEDSAEYILIEDAIEEIEALVKAAAESATAAAESAEEAAENAVTDALAALGFGVDDDGYIYQEVEDDE